MGTILLFVFLAWVVFWVFLVPTLLPLYLWLDEIWSERKETKRILENS